MNGPPKRERRNSNAKISEVMVGEMVEVGEEEEELVVAEAIK